MIPAGMATVEPKREPSTFSTKPGARKLAPAGYACAALLMVIPIVEALAAGYPWDLGSAQWRFGAAGLLSRALLIPCLGLCLAAGVAAVMHHRRTLRTVSLLAGLGCLSLVILAGMFALDAMQSSSLAQGEIRATFWLASANALVKYLAIGFVCGILASCAWRASVKPPDGERPKVETVWG
jgi:hypothetical protein